MGGKIHLLPPKGAPTDDPDITVNSTAPKAPEARPPRAVTRVAPVRLPPVLAVDAAGNELADVDLPPNEELPEPPPDPSDLDDTLSEAEEAARHLIAESGKPGPARVSYFSSIVESYATDPRSLIDPVFLSRFNLWLSRYLALQAAAKAAVDDLSHAVTEKGATIDLNITGLGGTLSELLHLRQLRDLISDLGLSEYADAILLGEIDREFGRAKELESEKKSRERLSQNAAGTQELILETLQRMQGTIERQSSLAAAATVRSPYHPAPRAPAQAPAQADPPPVQEAAAPAESAS